MTVSPQPTFTGPASGTAVNRRLGMTVAWNPGGATGSIPLLLSVSTVKGDFIAATCTVVVGDGSFTIPAYALLALPSSGGIPHVPYRRSPPRGVGALFRERSEPGNCAGDALGYRTGFTESHVAVRRSADRHRPRFSPALVQACLVCPIRSV